MDGRGKVYFFRYLDGKTPRIKINFPDPGVYTPDVPMNIVKTEPIELPDKWPVLPPAQRDRVKELTVISNPSLTGTPLRVFTQTGIIEAAPVFYSYPLPMQVFLLEHERAHQFYVNEDYCDLFALVNYLRMGYNASMAYYTAFHILKRSQANVDRLKQLFNNIQKTQTKKI
jgi:hypothetical protein